MGTKSGIVDCILRNNWNGGGRYLLYSYLGWVHAVNIFHFARAFSRTAQATFAHCTNNNSYVDHIFALIRNMVNSIDAMHRFSNYFGGCVGDQFAKIIIALSRFGWTVSNPWLSAWANQWIRCFHTILEPFGTEWFRNVCTFQYYLSIELAHLFTVQFSHSFDVCMRIW